MPISPLPVSFRKKKTPGPPALNPRHPLGRGLVFACVFTEGNGTPYELVTGSASTQNLGNKWKPSPLGIAAQINSSTVLPTYNDVSSWHPGSSDFTLAVYGNPTASASLAPLWRKSPSLATPFWCLYANGDQNTNASSGRLACYAYQNSSNNLLLATTSTSAIDGKYHQFVGALSPSNASGALYVDGLPSASSSSHTGTPSYTGTDKVYVGGDGGANNAGCNLAYAYFWLRQLSAQEVEWLYAEPFCFLYQSPAFSSSGYSPHTYNVTGSGGVLVAGADTDTAVFNPATTGQGVLCAGSAAVGADYNPATTGQGVLCAGNGAFVYPEISTGGVLVAGADTDTAVFNPGTYYGVWVFGADTDTADFNPVISPTGVLCDNGASPAGTYNIVASGGVMVAGAAFNVGTFYTPTPLSGVLCNGSAVAQDTYNIAASGGVLCSGAAVVPATYGNPSTGGALVAGSGPYYLTLPGSASWSVHTTPAFGASVTKYASASWSVHTTWNASATLLEPLPLAGVLCNGSAASPATYNLPTSGGVRVGGSAVAYSFLSGSASWNVHTTWTAPAAYRLVFGAASWNVHTTWSAAAIRQSNPTTSGGVRVGGSGQSYAVLHGSAAWNVHTTWFASCLFEPGGAFNGGIFRRFDPANTFRRTDPSRTFRRLATTNKFVRD